jgi:phosphohistidine phosphatase SixA
LRHAKSSWKDQQLADFDWPLNKRSRTNVPLMEQIRNLWEVWQDVLIVGHSTGLSGLATWRPATSTIS